MRIRNRLLFIFVLIGFVSCKTYHSDIEICFENAKSRIGSESILNKLKASQLDSYGEFSGIMSSAFREEAKSDSICKTALNKFLLENKENSITVNNLIFFQEFQAYLRDERFDKFEARDLALKYEKKWK